MGGVTLFAYRVVVAWEINYLVNCMVQVYNATGGLPSRMGVYTLSNG